MRSPASPRSARSISPAIGARTQSNSTSSTCSARGRAAGVAAPLMDWVLATARARGYARIVLSVFVDNLRAQRFYARYGFAEVGRYRFAVGEHLDDDRIWARDL
ncbi:MAG: GNAT family N-acetyltransferase [Sphingomonas sp.]